MSKLSILLTGASGLLGQNLKLDAFRPSHSDMDIATGYGVKGVYDLIIHAAAYTKVQQGESEKKECYDTNVTGTLNLLLAYPDTPFVYISSEYAKSPVNFYSLTKSLAEQLVFHHTAPHLIIRTLFKPFPYPYEFAFTDQWTMGDTVDIIAPLIEEAINKWDRRTSATYYVGTGRKTMFELAKKSKPDVLPNSIKDMKVKIPNDYT